MRGETAEVFLINFNQGVRRLNKAKHLRHIPGCSSEIVQFLLGSPLGRAQQDIKRPDRKHKIPKETLLLYMEMTKHIKWQARRHTSHSHSWPMRTRMPFPHVPKMCACLLFISYASWWRERTSKEHDIGARERVFTNFERPSKGRATWPHCHWGWWVFVL